MSTTNDEERPSGTIVARQSRRAAVVHLPDPESEEPEPLCNVAAGDTIHRTGYTRGRWVKRDHSVYPNREKCNRCERLEQGKTEAPGPGETQ